MALLHQFYVTLQLSSTPHSYYKKNLEVYECVYVLDQYQVDPETPLRYMTESSSFSLLSWLSDPNSAIIALKPPPEPSTAILGTLACQH